MQYLLLYIVYYFINEILMNEFFGSGGLIHNEIYSLSYKNLLHNSTYFCMRSALLYQLIAFILAFFHNSSQTFSFFIKYSNCDCILSAFDFTNFQIHSAISKQPELFVVVIQHPHDIHSKILMGPFSDTDGRQKIMDLQRSFIYSLLLLSIRQCRMILFLDFF